MHIQQEKNKTAYFRNRLVLVDFIDSLRLTPVNRLISVDLRRLIYAILRYISASQRVVGKMNKKSYLAKCILRYGSITTVQNTLTLMAVRDLMMHDEQMEAGKTAIGYDFSSFFKYI